MEKPQRSGKECEELILAKLQDNRLRSTRSLELGALKLVFLNNMIEHAEHLFLN